MPVSLAQGVGDPEDELPRRGQPGADGGAAKIDDAQTLLAFVDAPAVAGHRLGIRPHLAAQGGQHGILQLGAADLDDMREALFGGLKGFLQGNHASLQLAQRNDRGQPQSRRVGVVRGLMQVDIVQRRDARVGAGRLAEQLQRAIGQHLVHVHVRAGPRPALQAVHHDVPVQQAFAQFPAGTLDRIGFGGIIGPGAQRAVGHGAGQLHRPVGAGQARGHRLQGQRKVLERADSMNAVQGSRRDRQVPSRSDSVRKALMRRAQIRRPKSEGRKKSEIRRPKSLRTAIAVAAEADTVPPFRISDFGLLSAFGFGFAFDRLHTYTSRLSSCTSVTSAGRSAAPKAPSCPTHGRSGFRPPCGSPASRSRSDIPCNSTARWGRSDV